MQNILQGLIAFGERRRRALQMLLTLLTAAALAVISVSTGPLANLYYIETWEARRLLIVLVYALLPLGMGYVIFVRGAKGLDFLFLYGALTAALLLRTTTLSQIVPDYAPMRAFVEALSQDGLAAAPQGVGRYGLLGTYLFALIARVPIRELYLFKYVAIACDFALAFALCALVERFVDRRRGTVAMLAVLYNPLTWLTSAYWGRWDALCALLVVLSLLALLQKRRTLCAVLFALAYAASPEALFLLPLLLLWPHHGLKASHLGAALLTLLAAALPMAFLSSPAAALEGVGPARLFADSAAQLQNCAPTLYQFVPASNLRYREQYGFLQFVQGIEPAESSKWYTQEAIDRIFQAGVYAAVVVLLGAAAACRRLRRAVSKDQLWQVALMASVFVPMILPGMNPRSFYLASSFSLLYALRYEKRIRVAVLVMGAAFLSYVPSLTGQYVVPLTLAMGMNVLSLFQVGRDFAAQVAPRARELPELRPAARDRI